MLRNNLIAISVLAAVFSWPGNYAIARSTSPFFMVTGYGAVGDGQTKDTQAIQKAVDASAKTGGGTVYFPPGTYLTGTIVLKNNVTLKLEAGARILGSPDSKDYPCIDPDIDTYSKRYCCQGLIYADHAHDIAIVGRGIIDGQGAAFPASKKDFLFRKRPCCIRFIKCRNVLIDGIRLQNSAFWTQHYLACENLKICGISVYCHANYTTDMLMIDGCRNVLVSDCYGDTGDDAITLKSSGPAVCENVTITNCTVSSKCNAIKMGTESSGGFKNITISNCTISPSKSDKYYFGWPAGTGGIALEAVDGAIMDRITISNIVLKGVLSPIFMRLGDRARKYKDDMPRPPVGAMRNIVISNIVATDAQIYGSSIMGIPGHRIENVTLSNINITYLGGGTKEDAARIVPEKVDVYPDAENFGRLSSYGLYCRHIDGLILNNVKVRFDKSDYRPALFCDDVLNLEVICFKGTCLKDGYPMMVLNDVTQALFQGCIAPADTGVFLRMQGKTDRVSVIGNDLSQAQTPFEFEPGTPKAVLYQSNNRIANR
ncbi:MAG: glycoside hydrolase family 28 protein [Planctomycetota bacterium]